ncbi:MAG TPA: EAL domain-containing protein [Terracidiphilus sp.]|nr:EAL domain-containing protein [Terracidiphilus sp.]
MILGVAAGSLLGLLWSREVVLRGARQRLSRFAEQIRANGENSADEARAVLHDLNAQGGSPCSDTELQTFRRLVYNSEYLKDVGRVADAKIQCSAVLGRPAQAWAELGSGFLRPDGTRVYRNLAPYAMPGQTVVAVQSGDALVVYSPYNLRLFQSQPMHFVVSDRDLTTGAVRDLIGEMPTTGQSGQIFSSPVAAVSRGVVYATNCSPRYAACMTAWMTVPQALQAERDQYRIYVGLSALCGALLGMAVSLFYRRSRSMEQQLRRAVRQGRLRIAFEPVYDLQSGQAVAAEALARWTDEDGFPVSPEIFIKVAEDRGFIGDITALVVQKALRALRPIAAINPDFRVNVNITSADIKDPHFLSMLSHAVRSAKVPARCLGIEITESSWAEWDSAPGVLASLRQLGHLVHIDDFGKGYSSLAQLHHLPVDVLKVDKEFTQSIGTESVKTSIVPQILAMATALQLQVVVEGIANTEQVRYYAACQPPVLAQGWYFGRSMTLEELLHLLRSREPHRGFIPVEAGASSQS